MSRTHLAKLLVGAPHQWISAQGLAEVFDRHSLPIGLPGNLTKQIQAGSSVGHLLFQEGKEV